MSASVAPVLRRSIHLAVTAALAGSLALPAGVSAAPTTAGEVGGHTGIRQTVPHDVTFIAMLVPHHQGAVEMASVAARKATKPQVRRLAARIVRVQNHQILQMRRWLREHHAEPMRPPAAVRQMERQNMRMLHAARGKHVDPMFLMMMRMHHAEAVGEAMDELRHGRDPFALKLAKATKADQTRELSQMNRLLASMPMPMGMGMGMPRH